MHNRNIDDVTEHWDISHFPTFAGLTVASGNVSVPHQASTFVPLTLGLLGLVMSPRHCLRRFAPSVASFGESPIRVAEPSPALSRNRFCAGRYNIRLTANSCIALSSSTNAVSISSKRTMKRFP
jgi:hypothetical protein